MTATKHLTRKAPPIPVSMTPSQCRVVRRSKGATVLFVLINTTRMESPVKYSLDGGDWKSTPYQTADFGLGWTMAAKHVWDWLALEYSIG